VGTRSFTYADDPKSLASCRVASGKASLVGQVRKRETSYRSGSEEADLTLDLACTLFVRKVKETCYLPAVCRRKTRRAQARRQ
jgi:hypothetical protein